MLGGQSGRVIGDVINHGKHEFWGRPNMHYHQGMVAGENTLNAVCARLVMRRQILPAPEPLALHC